MRESFYLLKKYIVKHPRVAEYKPASEKFDENKMLAICQRLPNFDNAQQEDKDAILNFVDLSKSIHELFEDFYKHLLDNLNHLNLKGCEIAEYFVAILNKEFKVVMDKHWETMKKVDKGTYFTSDFLDFKIQSSVKEMGLMDSRAAFECATDSISLILNFLRYSLDKAFVVENANPQEFAGRIRNVYQMAQMVVVSKHSYDDILYNGGFIMVDREQHVTVFDYDNHERLKLLRAGDMMFAERRIYMFGQMIEHKTVPRLFRYVTTYRIKKASVNNGCISLSFGQSDPKEHKAIASDIQNAIDAYYEFLDGNLHLPNFANATIDEAVSVWIAVMYIAQYMIAHVEYDTALYKKEDFTTVPSKIAKVDLQSYIQKLTGISTWKIQKVLDGLSVDWGKFNDIWKSMLYPVGDYYLLPFFPLINSAPYNVIDSLLLKGGLDLQDRGKVFEKYLYDYLKSRNSSYPITCMPTGMYGKTGEEEEIDVLIGMKNVVLVGDAKCIHYSVEPINYAEAWGRLKEGCEQAKRKAEFVRQHPEYFKELGNYSGKKFLPFVVTNYPTFTGFEHDGVYVVDSHGLLAYLQCGIMSMREMGLNDDPIRGIRMLYHNEDEYSDNIEGFFAKNPIKEEFLKRIEVVDIPLANNEDSWKVLSKSAQVKNNPQFNIV